MGKTAFVKKSVVLTSKLDFAIKKNLVLHVERKRGLSEKTTAVSEEFLKVVLDKNSEN